MAIQEYTGTDAFGDEVTLYDTDDPPEGSTLRAALTALQSLVGALTGGDGDPIRANVTDLPSADVASLPGNPAQTSDVGAVETAVQRQSSYDGVTVNPPTGQSFTPPYNGILLTAVDGDLQIVTGEQESVVLPQAALTAGQVLPVTVDQIKANATTQTLQKVLLLRE
jgi:hypothetical protein